MPYADPDAQREYQRKWVASRRAEFFGDKTCEWCGSSESLHLHHRDPNKKVSHSIWSWSKAKREAEIAKCIVVCQPCHFRAHGEAKRIESQLRHPCGTIHAFWRGCRCRACKDARNEYQRRCRVAA